MVWEGTSEQQGNCSSHEGKISTSLRRHRCLSGRHLGPKTLSAMPSVAANSESMWRRTHSTICSTKPPRGLMFGMRPSAGLTIVTIRVLSS